MTAIVIVVRVLSMIIVALADIHGSLDYLGAGSGFADDLKKADLVLIAGDITNFSGRQEVKRILDEITRHNSHIYAVPGNCDLPEVDEYLRSEGMNLNCNCVAVGEIVLTGLGGALACSRHIAGETGEQDHAVCLGHVESMVPADKKVIFVSHKPAFGTKIDDVGHGSHNGSRAIRSFIENFQPILAVSGHIHEAPGIDRIGETTLINPGPFRHGSYGYVEMDGAITKAEIRYAG